MTAGTDADMNKLAAMLLALADGYPPTVVAHSVDQEEPTAVFLVENPRFAPDNGEDPNIAFEVNDLRAIASRLRAQAVRLAEAERAADDIGREYRLVHKFNEENIAARDAALARAEAAEKALEEVRDHPVSSTSRQVQEIAREYLSRAARTALKGSTP